jgi:hypothetical protein
MDLEEVGLDGMDLNHRLRKGTGFHRGLPTVLK